jgi:hypothetical protein
VLSLTNDASQLNSYPPIQPESTVRPYLSMARAVLLTPALIAGIPPRIICGSNLHLARTVASLVVHLVVTIQFGDTRRGPSIRAAPIIIFHHLLAIFKLDSGRRGVLVQERSHLVLLQSSRWRDDCLFRNGGMVTIMDQDTRQDHEGQKNGRNQDNKESLHVEVLARLENASEGTGELRIVRLGW